MNNTQFKTGDIVLIKRPFIVTNPYAYLALIIRKVIGTEYNHSGVIIIENDIPYIYEARENGFIKVPLYDRLNDPEYTEKYRIYRPIYKEFDSVRFILETYELKHRKYDIKGLTVDQLLFHLFGIWVGSKSESEALTKLYCYEAVWYLHRDSGVFGKEWWKSKPIDIIKKSKNKFKLIDKR